METIWEFLKSRWRITRKELKEMGIDDKKQWEDATQRELGIIASHLDITVEELIKY